MGRPTRRDFLKAGAMAGLGALGNDLAAARPLAGSTPESGRRWHGQGGPVLISSATWKTTAMRTKLIATTGIASRPRPSSRTSALPDAAAPWLARF